MHRLLLLSLTLVFSLPLSAALACDDIKLAKPDSKCVSGLEWNGQRGVWFELGKVQETIFKMKVFDDLEFQVDQLTKANGLYARQTAELRSAVSLHKSLLQDTQTQLDLAIKGEQSARAELAAGARWYKSPIFWGITMFVAGAAIQNVCCSRR